MTPSSPQLLGLGARGQRGPAGSRPRAARPKGLALMRTGRDGTALVRESGEASTRTTAARRLRWRASRRGRGRGRCKRRDAGCELAAPPIEPSRHVQPREGHGARARSRAGRYDHPRRQPRRSTRGRSRAYFTGGGGAARLSPLKRPPLRRHPSALRADARSGKWGWPGVPGGPAQGRKPGRRGFLNPRGSGRARATRPRGQGGM